jgi:hypothetical protein
MTAAGAFIPSVERPTPGLAQFFGHHCPIKANFQPLLGTADVPVGGAFCTIMDMPDLTLGPGAPPVPTPVLIQLAEPVSARGRILAIPRDLRDRLTVLDTANKMMGWPLGRVPTGPVRGESTFVPAAAPTVPPGFAPRPLAPSFPLATLAAAIRVPPQATGALGLPLPPQPPVMTPNLTALASPASEVEFDVDMGSATDPLALDSPWN